MVKSFVVIEIEQRTSCTAKGAEKTNLPPGLGTQNKCTPTTRKPKGANESEWIERQRLASGFPALALQTDFRLPAAAGCSPQS